MVGSKQTKEGKFKALTEIQTTQHSTLATALIRKM
jgi:hypothetical protein